MKTTDLYRLQVLAEKLQSKVRKNGSAPVYQPQVDTIKKASSW